MKRTLFFDLDNTLYPESSCFEDEIFLRMLDFTAKLLNTSTENARKLRHEKSHLFGTTLEWLIHDYNFKDIDSFLSAAHPEGEEACIEEISELRPFLESLDFPKYILTNSPIEHSKRVLKKLNIEDQFLHIYDIRFMNYSGKPHAHAFKQVMQHANIDIESAVLFDDNIRCVKSFLSLGGKAILIDELGRHTNEQNELCIVKSVLETKDALINI